MDYPEASEYERRIERFKSRLTADFAILSQSRDIYYFAGTIQPSILLVPKKGDPTLFFRMNFEKGKRETWISDVQNGGVKEACGLIKEGAVIGLEKDVLPVAIYESILKRMGRDLVTIDVTPAILLTRMIKSQYEIKMMKEASKISNAGHDALREALHDGISEIELAAEVEYAMRKAGHEGLLHIRRWDGFLHYGMISSGENLSIPSGYPGATITGVGMSRAASYASSSRKIRKGDLVMADIGGSFRGYHSDEARMFVVGKADDLQIERYEILVEIHREAMAVMKPGCKVSEVYDAAFKVVEEHGCADWFMGYWHYGAKYLGHGLGLEIDELPLVAPGVDLPLEAGMTIALEPKLIIPGWSGLDLEDTFLIAEGGVNSITYSRRDLAEV
jgi:Xaa-Pro aminopeptidase